MFTPLLLSSRRAAAAASVFARCLLVGGGALLSVACSDAKSGDVTAACHALKPEVSALETRFSSDPVSNGKTAAFVQASKDVLWASNTLEHDVAAACQRIGTDLGLAEHEMKADKGTGGFASGICNAVSKRLDLMQRAQGLRTWVTIAAPECQYSQNAWARCGTICNIQDPQCNLLCRIHANVHAACDQTQVRVRPARDQAVPPELMSTLAANLTSLVHAQIAIGKRIAPYALALNQQATVLTGMLGDAGSDAADCVRASTDAAKEAARRFRTSERAASDLLARVQGH